MRTIFIISIILLSCPWWGCTPAPGEKTTEVLASLEILPHPDTLNLYVNESQNLNLRGTQINSSQQTMSNSGLITDVKYTVGNTDTTTVVVASAKAAWASSNSTVATVSQGIVTAKNPGSANISASVGSVSAVPLLVNVRAVNTAPGLSLDPPLLSVIFRDTVLVTGNVQQQAILKISESSSAHNHDSVHYDAAGNFNELVTGIQTGYRTIVAAARNPNQSNLVTPRSKTVIYYRYLSPEADSICGNWLGTTVGQNFNFTISKNQFLPVPRYDVNGHIDIQFEGIGVVKDVVMTGVVNYDGTMDISLTQTYQGFKISGGLRGYFKSMGRGEGSYSAEAKKSGWPTLSGNADWTAVKIP